MRSYARNQASQATAGTILADIKANGDEQMSENTVYDYIKALKEIFVIEDSVAWNPNLRSKTAIRTIVPQLHVEVAHVLDFHCSLFLFNISPFFASIVFLCILSKGVAIVLLNLLRGSVVDVFQRQEMQIGKGTVDAYIKAKVHRLGIVVVEFAVAVTM